MEPLKEISFPSFDEFFQTLFEEDLSESTLYDPKIVALVKEHLVQGNIHSRAGNRLADALIRLAKERSREVSK